MNPERLLTKINLATPGMLSIAGGGVELTRQDIMASLGMGSLPESRYLMALAYYVYRDELRKPEHGRLVFRLANHAYAKAEDIAIRRRWMDKSFVKGIAHCALYEALFEDKGRCKTCNGSGEKPANVDPAKVDGVAPTVCPYCFGSGIRPMSIRSRALRSGIPFTTFHRNYQAKYHQVYLELVQWRIEALSHVYRYTREESVREG